MSPILYNSDEKSFNTKGLGQLNQLVTAEIHEVANSTYTATFVMPRSDRLYKILREGQLIKAKPNGVDTDDIFVINNLDTTSNDNTVTITCGHWTDLSNNSNIVKKIVMDGNRPIDVINQLPKSLDNAYSFTFFTDDTRYFGNYGIEYLNQNPNAVISGADNSLQRLTGDLVRKRHNKISLLYNRHSQIISVRRGKNIAGITIKRSNDGLVTKMVPYFKPKDDETTGIKDADPVYGTPITSPSFNKYAQAYVSYVDYSSRVDNVADMMALASKFFAENPNVDKPVYDVQIDLNEYNSKRAQNVQVGDIARIWDPDFDLSVDLPIYETVYNPVLEHMVSIHAGTQASDLFHFLESRIKETQDAIDETQKDLEESKKETDEKLDQAEKDTDEKIKDSSEADQQFALDSANGRSKNYYGDTEPNTAQEGDMWFKGALGDGDVTMYKYENGKWVELFPEGRDEELKAQMEKADEETEAMIKAAGFDTAQELYKAVSDNGKSIVSVKANANGLQTQITNNATSTSSRFTQLSNLFDSKISNTQSSLSSQITQKVNSIKLSVSGSGASSYLWLNGSSVELGGRNIHINGSTYIANGSIGAAAIGTLDAGKIVTGTLRGIQLSGVSIVGTSTIDLNGGGYFTRMSAANGISTSGMLEVYGWTRLHSNVDLDGTLTVGTDVFIKGSLYVKGNKIA